MRGKGQDGAITVFLSIILLIMITLAGVIVDVARINTAGPQIQRAVETSVRSSLAGYYKPLKEQYGLFALNENDEEILKETIVEYINKNLMIDEEGLDEEEYLDLYDYKIESISVVPIFNLTENPVTRQQILEYMKYRAPKEFVEGFIKKLEMFKKAGATSEVYEEKVSVEKKLKNIENIQRDIYKKIYGDYETYEPYKFFFWPFRKNNVNYFVRGLDKGEYTKRIGKYVEKIKHYKELKERWNNAADREEADKIEKQMNGTIDNMRKKYNELTREIREYSKVNGEARTGIDNLVDKSKFVIEDLKGFKEELEEKKESIMSEAYNQLSTEVESHENLLGIVKEGKDGDKINGFGKIIEELEDNKKDLDDAVKRLNEISPSKVQSMVETNWDEEEIEDIKENICKKLQKYNNEIEYDYKVENKGEEKDKEYDIREEVQNNANEKIQPDSSINRSKKTNKIENNDYQALPSTIKLKTDKENKDHSLGFLWRKNTDEKSDNNSDQPEDEGTKDEDIKEVEFHKQESFGFGESALSYLGDITENLNPKNIRDEIYINEYIMGMFKNYVSEVDVEYNLRNQEKLSQVSFFERSEVEYILNGSRSEKTNQILMDSKILVTRFALNSIHAFLCPEKNKTAGTTATVVAGVFTGGAGIPIIKTLIILGWSMAEATYDLQELKDGRDIVLYKTEDDWVTDLKGGKKESSKASSTIDLSKDTDEKPSSKDKNPMDTSYQDYLRFFLLVQKDDVTMTRLQDLIQLNMRESTGNEELRLDELNTYIKVEAVVSIKYLFLTQSFIPKEFKAKNDRYEFKVEIYQGY